MNRAIRLALSFCAAALLGALPMKAGAEDASALYAQNCAQCHGAGRLGGIGPALIPENLGRLKKKRAAAVIAKGRAATQMPSFSDKLSPEQIDALAAFVFTPLKSIPPWREQQIKESRRVLETPAKLGKPVFDADPLNLFVVVESGDHHATILNGDTFEPIHRFKTHFALHGGPKFTPDGRFVFFASRDGWITKYDLWSLKVIAEVRAGINTRNIALSRDGKYVAVANYLPHTLVILNADDLKLEKILDVKDKNGNSSRVSAVYTAPPRKSFVAALKDVPEVWEISYDDNAPAGYASSWAHDYREESGDGPVKARFPVRRIAAADYLDDFFFDQSYFHLIGASRQGAAQVIDLDTRRVAARIDITGLPHLGSGITWAYKDTTVLATPNLKAGEVSIVDMKSWQVIKRIKTLGPGFFMRSHENSRFAWVDVFFGPNKDVVHVIDKQTLEIVKTLKPAPGKTAAHVEFDRSGKHALLSIWDMDGAVIVYDAETFEEIKRLPMVKPSGKYNVHNKITFSEGTSH